ncbi:hypothetical protein [Streptomyces sp. NPDC127084]|uniref:hypothetical protein n=1 Tax=Streptomyces sp. NPDC127084 TaxID=3347133 RepID=UPI0036488046
MTGTPGNAKQPQGASPDRGVLDEALEPEQVRSLNSALRKLAETGVGGKDMQEAAKRLLSGQLALRDAMDDPTVARALGGGLASLRGQWESLSEEEREQVRRGEAASPGGPSSGASEPTSPERRKDQGRHSGGFSLY